MTTGRKAGRTNVRSAAFTAYRVLWGLAFVVAVAFIAIVHPRDELAVQAKHHAFMRIGFGVWWNPSSEGQLGSPFGQVGRQAGIGHGDLIYALDDRPLPPDAAGRIKAVGGPNGSIATLRLRRPDGSTYVTRVVRSDRYEPDAYAGSGITFTARRWAVFAVDTVARLVALAAALLLFLRRPRDPVAGLLSGAFLLSCLVSGNIATTLPGVPGLLVSQLNLVAVPIAILLFPNGRPATAWHWLAMACVLANGAAGLVPAQGLATWVYLLGYGASLALIASVAAQFQATPPGEGRQQIKFVLLGAVASMLLFALGQAVDQISYGDIPEGTTAWIVLVKWTIFALSNLALPAGLLVSLVRYRLYDADTAIARSVAYGALTLSLLAVFAGSEKLIEVLGEEYFGERLGALAGGLGAAVAAVLIVPLHHRAVHWAEHRFRRHLTHLRHSLPLSVGDLRETASPARIGEVVLDAVAAGVHASRAALIVGDSLVSARDTPLDEVEAWRARWTPTAGKGPDLQRSDALFPMRIPLEGDGHVHVGWLLLGPRPDGSLYGRDEREVLAEIADPVGRALAIAQHRRVREVHLEGLVETLSARLAALEAALGHSAKPKLAPANAHM